MNLREAIGDYAVHYGRCQEVIGWEGEGAERIRRQFGEVVERLCRVVKVAEAAIALAEYQAFTPYNSAVEDELWRAFVETHKAAKAANQQ
jgi:hypothetical protein